MAAKIVSFFFWVFLISILAFMGPIADSITTHVPASFMNLSSGWQIASFLLFGLILLVTSAVVAEKF